MNFQLIVFLIANALVSGHTDVSEEEASLFLSCQLSSCDISHIAFIEKADNYLLSPFSLQISRHDLGYPYHSAVHLMV